MVFCNSTLNVTGWALGEHATWSKYSNFDVAVHVPLIISIPAVTFSIDNYSEYAKSADRMKYNAAATSDGAFANKTDSKYMVLDVRKIGVWKTYKSTEYIIKREKTFPGIRRKCNKCAESGAVNSKSCRATNAVVELVDIFPTIADLAGVPMPICQINDQRSRNIFAYRKEGPNPCSEGITLLPLIKSTLRCQVRCASYST
jgi:hypothetical protein